MDYDLATTVGVPNATLPLRGKTPAQSENSTELYLGERRPIKYLPLDLGTIRLLRVKRELSKDGLIQCDLEHSSLDCDYRCLSYVWGPPGGESQIEINGQIALVRPNLHDFLNIAREKYAFEPLWIDALCIDQDNVPERNHQVQDMGNIYSRARMVVAWLGDNQELAIALKALRKRFTPRSMNPFPKDYYKHHKRREDCPLLTTHEYWKRAWIVQEILLARSVVLLAANARFNIALLPEGWYSTYSHIGPLLSPMSNDIPPNLLSRLHQFRVKECAVPYDRIYSLLSLCERTPEIEVDYNIPAWSLCIRVLEVSAGAICLCTILTLLKALDIHPGDIPEFDLEDGEQEKQPVIETVHSGSSMLGVWCVHKRGGHTLVLHSLCDRFHGTLRYESAGKEGCSVQYYDHGERHFRAAKQIKSSKGITVAQDAQSCHWRFSLRAIAEVLEPAIEQYWAVPIPSPSDGWQACCLRADTSNRSLNLCWPQS